MERNNKINYLFIIKGYMNEIIFVLKGFMLIGHILVNEIMENKKIVIWKSRILLAMLPS